jgi:hypothetical protein
MLKHRFFSARLGTTDQFLAIDSNFIIRRYLKTDYAITALSPVNYHLDKAGILRVRKAA